MSAAARRFKVDIHSRGVALQGSLADLVDAGLGAALQGLERSVLRVHVRLYAAEGGGVICYIRAELTRGEGLARGDVGEHAGEAVERASARVRAALMDRFHKGGGAPAAGGTS